MSLELSVLNIKIVFYQGLLMVKEAHDFCCNLSAKRGLKMMVNCVCLRFSRVTGFFLRFYLFICQRERKHTDRGRGRGRGRGRSRLPAEEPDVELDPRTPGSCPEPKADT